MYNGSYWTEIDKENFQSFLGNVALQMGVEKFKCKIHTFKDELFKQFMADAYLPTPQINKNNVLINLQNGTFEITPKNKFFSLNLKEVWQYRDLLLLFVKRDVVTVYKQTVLGPLWYLIQPLFTSVTFTIIFNSVAGINTGTVPPFLFNLAGITVWNYFTACLNETSDTFKKNASIFGKVYFPRAIMPISTVITNLIKLGIQLLIFFSVYVYFY